MIVSVERIFIYIGSAIGNAIVSGGALYIVIGYTFNNDKSSVKPIVVFGAWFIEHV